MVVFWLEHSSALLQLRLLRVESIPLRIRTVADPGTGARLELKTAIEIRTTITNNKNDFFTACLYLFRRAARQ